jgi:hypothetical protein
VDLSVPSISIKVNGSDVAMTVSTSLVAGNGSIGHSRAQGFVASAAGGSPGDCQISDLYFDPTQVVAESSLHDSGAAIDLSSVGSPWVYVGADMTADERGAESAQGWNDGYNLGSGGSLTVTSATFSDVA